MERLRQKQLSLFNLFHFTDVGAETPGSWWLHKENGSVALTYAIKCALTSNDYSSILKGRPVHLIIFSRGEKQIHRRRYKPLLFSSFPSNPLRSPSFSNSRTYCSINGL